MFHAVCHKFAQAMGPDTLIPVKSMDRATEIRPLNVVVKKTKRKFIFFKKTHFMPYNFQLQDLLREPQKSLDASIKTFEFCEFNPTSKYSLSGKIGVQIMEELMDAELSASDSVVISSPLGVIEKQDVAPEILLKSLCDRRVNFDHTFVQQVREGSADVLCIITGVCQVKKDAEIKRVDNIDGEVDLKGKVPSCKSGGEISGKETDERDQDVVVPAGTPIAYNVVELIIDTANGYMEPQVVKGCHGGFVQNELTGKLLNLDVSDAPSHAEEVTEELMSSNVEEMERMKKILSSIKEMETAKKGELKSLLTEVMSHPADIERLADLGEMIEDKLVKADSKMKLSSLQTDKKKSADLLRILGFNAQESLFSYQGEVTPLMTAAGYIFDALEELTDSELLMMRECLQSEQIYVNQLSSLCASALVKTSPIRLTTPLPPDSTAHRLAVHLGFTLQNDSAVPPKTLRPSLDEIYCVLYSFSDV